jgi:hypothetical protein
MKGKTDLKETEIHKKKKISTTMKQESSPADLILINHIAEILAAEGNESFRNYLEWLGLSHDPKLVILSSTHHYYYDAEEMQNVKTVVNLRELNQIKDITGFFQSMFFILPPKCYLIGCFVDSRKRSVFSLRKRSSDLHSGQQTEDLKNGIISRIPFLNAVFSFLDAKTNKKLSGNTVSLLLRNSGFKIIDMTEFEGLTYFCTQSQRTIEN